MTLATPGPAPAEPDAARQLADVVRGQEFVRDVARPLLHVGADDLDGVIRRALGRVGRWFGVDRAYVFTIRGDRADNSHEWCAPGVTPEIDNLQDLPLDVIRSWLGRLSDGEPVEVGDVSALGAERSVEREILEAQGIRSLLVVPMLSLGELVGFVGFDAVRARRRFTPLEVELLRTFADVVTSALVRRRSEAKAALAEQRLAALTRYATDYVLIIGDDDRIRFASRSWGALGLSDDQLVGTCWHEHVHPGDSRGLRRVTRPVADRPVGSDGDRVVRLPDFRVRTGTGSWRWLAGSISDVRHDGVVDGWVVNAHDVTDRRTVQEQLAHDARHDPLTGLGNRSLFTEELGRVCRRAQVQRTSVGVVFLDLDRFKLVNDGHGHAAGDEVLVEVGRRLARVVRDGDTVARFGGDEFVVLLDGFDDADEVGRIVHRLERALDPPVEVGGNQYRVTASMGVVLGGGGSLDPVAMLRDADTAMYRAKDNGRGRVVVFDETLRTKVLRRLTLIHRLPRALEEGAIELAFQPVVEASTGNVVGAEALARWFDDDLGAVSPAEFIPVCEETGTVTHLTRHVLDAALAAVAGWPDRMHVAVNLSLSQLAAPGLDRTVADALRRAGVPGSRLCVEVTESSLMHDPATASAALRRLRDLGVRTALDDFGTGYSSLALLRELPIDVLKIDRAFVRGVDRDDRDRRLVDAVIGLAHDFHMETLAEGVEKPEQHRALVDAGCSLAQGFLFGRPVPAGELPTGTVTASGRGDAPAPDGRDGRDVAVAAGGGQPSRKPSAVSQSAATTSASSRSTS